MDLTGKRAIVTGATKGIGLAIAEGLGEAGVRVVVNARNASGVRATVRSMGQRFGADQVSGCPGDVGDPEDAQKLVKHCLKAFGGLEILVNNAGIGIFKKVEELQPEEWRRLIRTNLDGVFFTSHYAIPEMRRAGWGFILNISSLAGANPFPLGAAYNASKFALTGFSEALMQEVRHDDIRVAYVMPGSVDTAFRSAPTDATAWKLSPKDIADVVLETLRRDPRCLTSRIEMRPSKPPKK